jgi:hypothetical protein
VRKNSLGFAGLQPQGFPDYAPQHIRNLAHDTDTAHETHTAAAVVNRRGLVNHPGPLQMARCEQGYLCDVCKEEVESIRDSDLYLRFVIGELPSRHLLAAPERHLRCNPVNAQFIDSPDFEPVFVEGDFDRRLFDAEFVRTRTLLVTRGWLRLQELAELAQSVPLPEYPLPEFRK